MKYIPCGGCCLENPEAALPVSTAARVAGPCAACNAVFDSGLEQDDRRPASLPRPRTGDASARRLLNDALIFLVRADTAVSSHAQCRGLFQQLVPDARAPFYR